MEQWKDVVGYESLYQVSNLGNVKSLDKTMTSTLGKQWTRKGKTLALIPFTDGYIAITATKNKKIKTCLVHRLVADAFLSNPENKPQVNHIDGDKTNNTISNLEWVTRKENMRHATETGLRDYEWMMGTKHPKAKLTDDAVRFIRHNYKPHDKEFGRKQLMEKFGISKNTLQAVLTGKTWKHVA